MSNGQVDGLQQWAKENEASAGEAPKPIRPISVSQLGELLSREGNDPNELLKNRFLCRAGGLLLVGPTGIGKSSFSMQAMIMWAAGLPMFGIQPVKPLKSLLVQAENDDWDLKEMGDGVIAGVQLNEEQRRLALGNVLVAREDERSGVEFGVVLHLLLEEHRPDLVWIDPVLAYLGGEVNSQKDVGGFLRNMLNPLLREFNCGAVVVHHTNKPPAGVEKPDWRGSDFAYLGSGSAEFANWSRAVLAVRSVGSPSVFELRAGKRGGRLGWTEADGKTKSFSRMIAHSKKASVICWEYGDESEVPRPKTKRIHTKEDILAHVPPDEPISKAALRLRANQAGIGMNTIDVIVTELVKQGLLHVWLEKRPGTNPMRLLCRKPQPTQELL
jgi:hypothetical protein